MNTTKCDQIYILEGRYEDYGHNPGGSSAISSSSYAFGSWNPRHSHYDDSDTSPARLTQLYHRPTRGRKPYRMWNTFSLLLFYSGLGRIVIITNEVSESSMSFCRRPSLMPFRGMSKLKEEQERLRRRQAELERMRRAAEDRQDEDDRNRRRSEQEDDAAMKIQSFYRGFKDRQALNERRQR